MKQIDIQPAFRKFEEAFQTASNAAGGLDYDLMYIRQVFLGMGRHFGLSPSESMLLALGYSLSKEGNSWCFMGQKGLADALNVSPQTIAEILERLEKKELLERGPKHPRWNTNQWRLSPKALDHLRYLKERITKQAESKGRYRKH